MIVLPWPLHRINLLFFFQCSLLCRVQFWTWGGESEWKEKEIWILQREEKI